MSTKRSIGILTVLNVVGAAVGLANSVVVARLFGTSTDAAVYFGASTLLTTMFGLTQTGQLVEIFLPIYHRRKEESGTQAARLAYSVMLNWFGVVTVGMSLVLLLAAPVLIGLLLPGFEPSAQGLGVRIFLALAPLVGLNAVRWFMYMLANAEWQFGRPESFSVIGSVLSILTILALAPGVGVWALVAAVWVGVFIDLLGLVWVFRRLGYRHRLVFSVPGFDHRSVFRQLLHTLWYLGSTQGYVFVFNAGLSFLPPSTYAVFKYVEKIFSRMDGVVLRPFTVVFFTHFSETVGRGMETLWTLGRRALRQSLIATSGAFVAIIAAGYPLLSALWGGEKFGHDGLVLAHQLLAVMFLLLYCSGCGQIARKAAMSLGKVRAFYLGASVVQLVSAAAAWYLTKSLGVTGAIATIAINVVGTSAVPVLIMLRSYGHLFMYPLRAVGQWTVAVTAGIAAAYALRMLNPGATLVFSGRMGELAWGSMLGFVSCSVLLAAAWLIGTDEIRTAGRRLRVRLQTISAGPADFRS